MTNPLLLENQVCFALHNAARAVDQLYRPLLKRMGITYPQYLVLLVLWEREHVTVKELGTALALDSGTLSPLLKRLEAAGLITRTRRPDDERSVEVRLTETGADLREQACRIPEQFAGGTGFDVAELTELRKTLVRLTTLIRTDTTKGIDK